MQSENVGKITHIEAKGEKIKVSFEKEKSLVLSLEVYTNYYLYVGKVVEKKEYDALKEEEKDHKNFEYAFSICAKKMYTKNEIVRKLKDRDADNKEIKRIISKLLDLKLLDDEAYCFEYIDYHQNRGEGYLKICSALKAKGIEDDLLKKYEYNYDIELHRASSLLPNLEKKYKDKSEIKQKDMIYHSLLTLGYKNEVVMEVIKNIKKQSIEEELEKLKVQYDRMRLRGYDRPQIIKKLMTLGFKYDAITRVCKGDNDE